jgi:hypothetical protein
MAHSFELVLPPKQGSPPAYIVYYSYILFLYSIRCLIYFYTLQELKDPNSNYDNDNTAGEIVEWIM